MVEYIKREAVIDLITRRYENPEICTQEINSIPAADVVPVVQGRWERDPASYWRWTPSGAVAVTRTTYRCGLCGRGTTVKSNYCPNCGAKMDGEPCTTQ